MNIRKDIIDEIIKSSDGIITEKDITPDNYTISGDNMIVFVYYSMPKKLREAIDYRNQKMEKEYYNRRN